MRKIIYKIQYWLYVDYMLSLWYKGENEPRSVYGRKLSLMLKYASHASVTKWKLHKRGPFGRAERLILESNGDED